MYYLLFCLLLNIGNTNVKNTGIKNDIIGKDNGPKEILHSLSESFEDTAYFPQWYFINDSNTQEGDSVHVVTDFSDAYDGSNVVRFGSFNTYGASEWLITPPLRVSDSLDSLVFHYRGWHQGAHEVFRLAITDSMPTGLSVDTTLFTHIFTPDTVTDTVWHRFRQLLKNYYNKDIRIAIHYISDYQWYLYVDKFTGPLVDTVAPYIKLVYPHSHFREQDRTRDTVKFLITDISGVRKAHVQDWGYKHRGEAQWTDAGYSDLMRNGDTFYMVTSLRDSLILYFYVYAEDSAGNYRINITPFNYNILPTMEWLTVYGNTADAKRVGDYFIIVSDSLMYPDTVTYWAYQSYLNRYYVDSLYRNMIYAVSYNPYLDTILKNFVDFGLVTEWNKRKRIILFSDDFAYYAHFHSMDTVFLNSYLKTRYIQDDWSSNTDTDTLNYMPYGDTFVINSPYPDRVLPYSPDSVYLGPSRYVYIEPADTFIKVLNGDSPQTYGGFKVNDLAYFAHYMPFLPSHMTQTDFSTLMDKILNDGNYEDGPLTISSGKLMGPDSIVVPADSPTGRIWGTAEAAVCYRTNVPYIRIFAQVGYGPDNSYPWEGGWKWFDPDTAFGSSEHVGDTAYVRDTFIGTMIAPSTPGHYDYCYRYALQVDTKVGPWIYTDLSGVNKNWKKYAYDYNPSQAGDMKVLYSYDISPVRIDTIVGKHWVGDTDSVFVVFKNMGYYSAKYAAFAYMNGVLQDTIFNIFTSDSDIVKLRVVYDKENGNEIRIVSKWAEDQDKSNDTLKTTEDARPYGLYLLENFDTWLPEGWSILNDVTRGWEHGTGSGPGDPDTFDGDFARFDSYWTQRGDSEFLVLPVLKLWNIGSPRLRFYYINDGSDDGRDSLIVMHKVNGNRWVNDYILHNVDAWTRYRVIYRDVGKKKGTIDTLYIRFLGYSDYGYTNIGVDSVMVFDATQLSIKEDRVSTFRFAFYKLKPNPSFDGFNIYFELPEDEHVRIDIYDIQGREVRRLKDGKMKRGRHSFFWNTRDEHDKKVKSGVYIIKLRAGDKVLYQRGILIRGRKFVK